MADLSARTVLIAGGSSAAGIAAARALRAAGARVLMVGSDRGRIEEAAAAAGGAVPLVCDLADAPAVQVLAADVHERFGKVDGVLHLVGGWRGADGITGQTDADWEFLSRNIVTTLRNVVRAFYDDLLASAAGRLAIVSSTAVTSPTAGGADYAAAKAAAETWVRAVASGFAAAQGTDLHSAAVVFAVKALVDDAMRSAHPERRFPGFTDVTAVADACTALFEEPAGGLNGARRVL
ncbi:SDR family NAD(P)-dependent oxidoreductase [Paenarthrobacter sp. DKR-5]|uniref:SDR family NAD(P)-dependent oxidoreductase n=1 Tax=Paenarthrobacter sp. DKR-5 TaxID=2835535 RepID=UPI001BDD6809|nr:SDR family NAD(P)-dependent oxidoreductase [Paenarthrobacter sp. DKR-5]MBT1002069.1 SDR family NAD(P)-dependent oxidoreductase [Paenarthrobacter sp. DKR-5]